MGLVRITSWCPKFNGSHFGLAPSLYPQNDWTEWQIRVNYDVPYMHTPHFQHLLALESAFKTTRFRCRCSVMLHAILRDLQALRIAHKSPWNRTAFELEAALKRSNPARKAMSFFFSSLLVDRAHWFRRVEKKKPKKRIVDHVDLHCRSPCMIRDHSRSAAAHACEVNLVSLSDSHCEESSLLQGCVCYG